MTLRHLPLRIEPQLLAKFHVVCKFQGRSANGQLIAYIQRSVRAFERLYGAIPVPELAKGKEEGQT